MLREDDKHLPRITFNIVVFNEEKRIRSCLDGIVLQEYPRQKMEILVLDGGSTDKTKEIAEGYGAQVIFNEKKLPEPGLAKGYECATGEYVVFMAADNVIHDPLWLRKTIQPFLDDPEKIVISFTRVGCDPKDNIWSKYLNEDTDPFNAFVYGNASHPEKFKKAYKVKKETENYAVYDYSVIDYPLIALAQCTIMKSGFERQDEDDDISEIVDLIDKGWDIAYVKNSTVFHYSLSGFLSYCRKFNRRIYNSMVTASYERRGRYMSVYRVVRQYLFMLYAASIVIPSIHAVWLAIQTRREYMLLHPLACVIEAYLIAFNFIKIKLVKL